MKRALIVAIAFVAAASSIAAADAYKGYAHICSSTGKVCASELPTGTASSTNTLYGVNGIGFVTTDTQTTIITGSGTGTATGTGTGTGSATATGTGTTSGTATETQVTNLPTTGTYTNNGLTITLSGTVTMTKTITVTGSGTVTGTDTTHGTSTFTETGSWTGTGTTTATVHATTTSSGTNTATGTTSTTHTGTQTVTWTKSGSVTYSYSGTVTGTGTLSGTATTYGTGTWTSTAYQTATSATVASNPTITYDFNSLSVPGGDRFLAWDLDTSITTWLGWQAAPFTDSPSLSFPDPVATPSVGSPAQFTGCHRTSNNCPVLNNVGGTLTFPASWISPGTIKSWLWAKATSAAQIKLFFGTCISGTMADSLPTVTVDVTSTDWQQIYATLPLPNGLLLPADYELCVSMWAYTSSGTPTVTLGATAPHYSRINGPWPGVKAQ